MLKNFRVLKGDNEPNVEGIDYPLLLNVNHITSIKPINILHQDNIIAGFWVRLTTGKKYKATRIPTDLLDLFEDDSHLAPMVMNGQNVASEDSVH